MNEQDFIDIWADGSELSEVGKKHMAHDLNLVIESAEARAAELIETNRELSESVETLRAERDKAREQLAQAVQAEREACAKVAEEFECDTYEEGWAEMERGARHCAAAIRARSNEAKP